MKPLEPIAVASFRSLTVRTYSRTMALPLTVDPARMTPKPSTRQRFAWSTTAAGMLRNSVFVMNDVSASVVPLIAAFSTFFDFTWPASAGDGNSAAVALAAVRWRKVFRLIRIRAPQVHLSRNGLTIVRNPFVSSSSG